MKSVKLRCQASDKVNIVKLRVSFKLCRFIKPIDDNNNCFKSNQSRLRKLKYLGNTRYSHDNDVDAIVRRLIMRKS